MILDDIEYITTEEAAQRLGVSDGRVRQMVYRGQLEHRKVGNTNLIALKAVEERLASSPKAGWQKGKPRKQVAGEES